jgi:hypothetical protein
MLFGKSENTVQYFSCFCTNKKKRINIKSVSLLNLHVNNADPTLTIVAPSSKAMW